jgi:glucose-1-phosphate thymidylyltransferase
MLVASPQYVEDFVGVLGSGVNFKSQNTGKQIQIVYGIQNEPSGIADGLWIAKDFVGVDPVVLHLGDNIIFEDLGEHVRNFKSGAKIFVKKVSDPERFGVATLDETGKVVEIVEKPQNPSSNLAVTGVYIYDNSVFDRMIGIPISSRGEYEITSVNNSFIKTGELEAVHITGDWFDVGTFDSLLAASNYMREKHLREQQG